MQASIFRQKRINIALTYIYGIGHPHAGRILDKAKVDPVKKVSDLSEEEVNRIRAVVGAEGLVEGDLCTEVSMNIKRLIEIGSYRGFRHHRNLRSADSALIECRTRKGRAGNGRAEEEGDGKDIKNSTQCSVDRSPFEN